MTPFLEDIYTNCGVPLVYPQLGKTNLAAFFCTYSIKATSASVAIGIPNRDSIFLSRPNDWRAL